MSAVPNVRRVAQPPPIIFLWLQPTTTTIKKIKAASYGKVIPMPITQAIDTLNFLHPGGVAFELCVIGPKSSNSKLWEGRVGGKRAVVAGWFRNPRTAAKLAVQIEAEGVYITLNPCQEALLARADHRLKAHVDRTADHHITRIKNLLIDVDAIRPAGVSSTDQEHQAALEMAQVIKADLAKEGWPAPMLGNSGNGGHLVYPLDLPNDQGSVDLVKAVLEALALRYADQLKSKNLEIDQKVFNPARLTKLYGTMVRKGDNTQDRPHRLAQIISFPQARHPVPLALLQKLAATSPAPAQTQTKEPSGGRFDLGAYLAHYGVEVVKVKPHTGSMLYCLQECLFDPSHNGNEAAIGQAQDGKLFYRCFHNSCQGRTWKEARAVISGSDKLGGFIIGNGTKPTTSEDYDRLEREAIQAEAKLTSIYSSSFSRDVVKLTTQVKEALKKGGLIPQDISYVVDILNKAGQIKDEGNLAADVREWVLSSSGVFHSSDVVKELGLSSMSSDRNFNKNLSKILERLVKDEILERVRTRRGNFRRVERESEAIDFLNADCSRVLDLKWPAPFYFERWVNLYPKNIVVVAGASNAGKTAMLLNVIKENMAAHRIAYFSSEMGPEELKLRLSKFPMPLSAWKFKPYDRAANFSDAIIPDAVNLIDYLELTDNFYQVGGQIKAIHDRLTTGVAIIALQKKGGAALGRGAEFTLEKARLYLSMDSGELKIIKGKNWAKPGVNPNDKVFKFKLVDGCKFLEG